MSLLGVPTKLQPHTTDVGGGPTAASPGRDTHPHHQPHPGRRAADLSQRRHAAMASGETRRLERESRDKGDRDVAVPCQLCRQPDRVHSAQPGHRGRLPPTPAVRTRQVGPIESLARLRDRFRRSPGCSRHGMGPLRR